MTSQSSIEWTEHTWNPVTGCTKISPGCKYCYAEDMARRLKAMGTPGYEKGFRVALHPERLKQPLQRQKPTMYFVNSMSDLFHEKVPFEFIDAVFSVIEKTPWHTYQILTKRADRLVEYCARINVPLNAWIGVSVENKEYGLPRIDLLRQVEANVRFLSIEPLLEDLGIFNLSEIHWVIVGGESGNRARPLQPNWVDSIQKQCKRAKVAFFFKQWGTWGADGQKRSKKANGRDLKGRTWNEMPRIAVANI